ncbi:MAG: HAD family hydrolase [Candidatus Thalassarchaeaceae archaeon]|tara:strand:+ start:289 stop:960 length:672 start_codon:yes stop_codon:yes gene_type:complete
MPVDAVVFDCDGVLIDNISSWWAIHEYFGTRNEEMLEKFLNKEITEEEFVNHDVGEWKKVQSKIHMDDIMRCYSGVKLMPGAREVIKELQSKGIFVAIVSSGVDLLIGTIANMLKVDDWAANGFEWDEDGYLIKGAPTKVYSHDKGIMVEKLIRINNLKSENVISVGDSSTDLSMKVGESKFIGFNPARERAVEEFEKARVSIVYNRDLRDLWPIMFDGEILK